MIWSKFAALMTQPHCVIVLSYKFEKFSWCVTILLCGVFGRRHKMCHYLVLSHSSFFQIWTNPSGHFFVFSHSNDKNSIKFNNMYWKAVVAKATCVAASTQGKLNTISFHSAFDSSARNMLPKTLKHLMMAAVPFVLLLSSFFVKVTLGNDWKFKHWPRFELI